MDHREQPSAPSAADLALALFELPEEERSVTVRPVRTDGELERLWELDTTGYGHACLPFDTLAAWWDAFPLGLWAVFHGPHLAGGFGLWPLPMAVGEQLRQGLLAECDLPAGEMWPFRDHPAAYWYASGLVVTPSARHTPTVKLLLANSLLGWIERCSLQFPMRVLALGQSPNGRLLLERCAFTCDRAGHVMPDGFPLYRLDVATRSALYALLRRRRLLPETLPDELAPTP